MGDCLPATSVANGYVSAKNRVRVAIVGCGRISELHALGYRQRDDAQISAVCDTNGRLARQKARDWSAEKVYRDYRQLLADPEIDLVELLVPHHCVGIEGEKGILFINRCTARTVALPALMLFRDGRTTTIPVKRDSWHHSFVDCAGHLIKVLRYGAQPGKLSCNLCWLLTVQH